MLKLPEDLTIGRLLSHLNLNFLLPLTEADIEKEAIHVLHIGDEKTITTPFPGEEFALFVHEDKLTLSLHHNTSYLLTSSKNISWSELSEQAELWLINEMGLVLGIGEQFSQQLEELFAQEKDFDGLYLLQKLISSDVFLINQRMDILGWAGGNSLPTEPIDFVPPHPTSSPIPLTPTLLPLPGKWRKPYQHLPLLWYPLSTAGKILGYIGISRENSNLSSLSRWFLYKTGFTFLFSLAKNQSIREKERQYHRDFLFDLLYNNFDSIEVICSRGKLWGWDFSIPHFVLVGEIHNYNAFGKDQYTLQTLVTEIPRQLQKFNIQAITLERNDQIVLLCPAPELPSFKEWEPAVQKKLEHIAPLIEKLLGSRRLLFGLGNLYPTAREIHRSFQEAKLALELGPFLYPDQVLIPFHSLGIMRLLHKFDHQELFDFETELLAPLIQFDQENDLNLEETLLIYFSCNADLIASGQRLFLHPNTVRYRVKKAGELLGLDLNRFENQVNVYIALKIGRLQTLWNN